MLRILESISRMVVVVSVIVVSLCGCTPQIPQPQFKLRIALFPIIDYLPYFVMLEQGFAKKNSLQFEEIFYQSGELIIKAMADGSADVGFIGSVPVVSAAERGLVPGTILPVAANTFADPKHPAAGILVTRSVSASKGLKGQFIAVNAVSSVLGAAIKARFQLEGVQDYKLVEIPFANMGLAVAGGNVAAAIIPEPFLTQSLLRNDGKLLGWVVGGPPFDHMELCLIVFRANFYRNNPQAVKAFLRAHLQAANFINKNPEKSRSILIKRLSLSQEVGQKMKLLRWSLDGRNDPALLESMQSVLVNVGMLKMPIPTRQLYDETLLEEVLKEKR